jgi:hypothetical protein
VLAAGEGFAVPGSGCWRGGGLSAARSYCVVQVLGDPASSHGTGTTFLSVDQCSVSSQSCRIRLRRSRFITCPVGAVGYRVVRAVREKVVRASRPGSPSAELAEELVQGGGMTCG